MPGAPLKKKNAWHSSFLIFFVTHLHTCKRFLMKIEWDIETKRSFHFIHKQLAFNFAYIGNRFSMLEKMSSHKSF